MLAPVGDARRTGRGARRGARDGRGRVQAPAPVPVGGRADPPRRGRRPGELSSNSRPCSRRRATSTTARAKVARLRASLGIARRRRSSRSVTRICCSTGRQALLRAADAVMRNAYAPVLAVQGRRRRARTERRDLRRRERRERRLPPGPVRRGLGYRRDSSPPASLRSRPSRWSPSASSICPPCGGCRQRLAEFGDAETPVYLGRPGRSA